MTPPPTGGTGPALLDVNALIALCWPAHDQHAVLRDWFRTHAGQGWATTLLTQSAFVRIVGQPAFAGRTVPLQALGDLLARNLAHPGHRQLPMDLDWPAVAARCTGGVVGHRQVTDAVLLATAIAHGARLLTLDRGIRALLATDAERQRWLVDPSAA